MKLIDIGRSGQIRTVMMRYKINVHAPVFGWDKIRIRTYLVKYSKFSSVRRFEVYGENGQLKIEDLAVWSMMSLEKMKLVAIPSEVKDMIEPYSGQKWVDDFQHEIRMSDHPAEDISPMRWNLQIGLDGIFQSVGKDNGQFSFIYR